MIEFACLCIVQIGMVNLQKIPANSYNIEMNLYIIYLCSRLLYYKHVLSGGTGGTMMELSFKDIPVM